MPEKLITLTTYTYITETYVLVAKLEAEGIQCHIPNENFISTRPFLSNAVGGLDVQVPEKDLAKAKEILRTIEAAYQIPEALKDYKKVLVYCPKCENTNVFRKKGSFFSFGKKEHVCTDCGHKWEK